MTDTVRIYLNGAAADVPKIASVLGAIEILDPDAAFQLRRGTKVLADSRGIPAALNDGVTNGAIFRLVSPKQAK
jgi:hypothetical protein